MSQDVPPLPSPDVPSAAVANSEVALTLIALPSSASPTLHHCNGGTNLFRDGAKKRHSDQPSMGSLGGCVFRGNGGVRHTRSDEISPRDPFNVLNDNTLEACNNARDNDKCGATHSPTPMYKKIGQIARKPKTRNSKVVFDSSYFFFLHPLMFDTEQFPHGHPQVYSQEEMHQFNANLQKQLAFNFCATRAMRKKSATVNKARASCLHDVDLNASPTSFSLET